MQMIKKMLYALALKERSPHKLALSFSLAVYIAFCPFVGLHTAMVFLFSWLLSLNGILLLAISNGINNPLTMVPIYASGHMAGDWLLGGIFGCDTQLLDPSWMQWFNTSVISSIGIPKLSLTAFLIGGNILGATIAVVLYPVAQTVFSGIALKIKQANCTYRPLKGVSCK